MKTWVRGVAAAITLISLLAVSTGSALARQPGTGDVPPIPAKLPWSIGISPAPCEDGAYRLIGAKWHKPYRWAFNASTTPKSLSSSTVRQILLKGFANMTSAHNDCGRADQVSATTSYQGDTDRRPNCLKPDGHNVVGFGHLQYGVLAVTCYWFRGQRMVEADLKINDREGWALSIGGCRDKAMLEATITHEAGHVFGLDHVGERKHGRQTMSPYLDGPCENKEATLGLGDILGMEAMY